MIRNNSLRSAPAIALCFLLASAGFVLADAPANDTYANPVLMTGASPAVVGTNAGATLESDEFNPRELGGASVWYRWVAPATGWHEVTTESEDPAHDLDTVLVLYRAGVDVAGAPRMGFNNDGFGPGNQSGLVFFAQSGQDYRIAVHGRDGQTGGFRLALGPVPAPGVRVASVVFSPPSVDVGTSSAGSTASVQIQSAEPFEGAYVYLRVPQTGQQIGFAYIEPPARVSGTELDGIYQAAFTVQAYRSAGMYPVTVYAWDNVDSYNWSPEGGDGREDFLLMPVSATLDVQNTGSVDNAPPVLQNPSGIPAVVDLTHGEVQVNVTMKVSDPLAGFQSGEIVLRSADDDWRSRIGSFDADDRTSGTAQDGSYAFTIRFRDTLPLGTLNLEYDVRDQLGNRARYGHPNGPPVPAGFPATIQITATLPANDTFANAIVLAPNNTPLVEGSTRFASRESGEPSLGDQAGGSVWYRWMPTTSGWYGLQIQSEDQDQVVGLFNGTTLPGLQERGRNDGSITDNEWVRRPLVFFAQSGITYYIAVCANSSYSTGALFQLELTAKPYTAPPLLVSDAYFLPSTIDIASGSRDVAVRIDVITDTPFLTNSSGPGWMQVTLRPDPAFYSGPPLNAYLSNANRISGTDTSGTYEAAFTLPPFIPPGPWDLVIQAGLAGSDRQVWTLVGSNPVADEYLVPGNLGANPRLQVNNTGVIDTVPPVLAAFSGLPATINLSGGPVAATFQLAITDVGGGFDEGSFWLISTGAGPLYNLGAITASNRVSGDALNGTYQISYTFATTVPPGQYALSIGLNDVAANRSSYGGDIFDNPFPDGSNSVIQITNVNTGYSGWAATQDFGPLNLNAPMDDPNGDGVPNILCYAFNLPPNGPPAQPMRPGQGDLSGLPAISVVGEGANRRLRIEFLRRYTIGNNLTYTPQFGDHLDPGQPGGLQDAEGSFSSQPVSPDWLRITIEDPVPGAGRRFGRVKVNLNE